MIYVIMNFMEEYDFVAIGDVTTDAFIDLKNIHVWNDGGVEKICMNFGDKIEYEHVDIIHGVGNAGNAAVSAARLGLNTALATFVGKDENGVAAQTVWEKDGVNLNLVNISEEYPTHYHFVLRYGAERTILIKHNPWPYEIPNFTKQPKWIYFSSVGEHGQYYHHELAEYVKKNGVKLAFQPGTFQIKLSAEGKINDLFGASEIFFCNKEEAQRILRLYTDDMVELVTAMRNLGPTIAVITDGPRGAFAGDGKHVYHMPMYPDPAPPVDRTGAGDSFSSTVTVMLGLGMSLPEALERGPINSMNVVQHVGAQEGLLSKEELEKLLQNAPEDYKLEQIA